MDLLMVIRASDTRHTLLRIAAQHRLDLSTYRKPVPHKRSGSEKLDALRGDLGGLQSSLARRKDVLQGRAKMEHIYR